MHPIPALAACLAVLTLAGCQFGQETEPPDQVLRLGLSLAYADPDSVMQGPLLTWGWNVFDPLVKLDAGSRPVPNVAERWEVSEDGLELTFHLRRDGRWSNGDPLTAHDYVYAWRFNLAESVELFESTGPFASIAGAEGYARCVADESECEPLLDELGVEAPDNYTLTVRFEKPNPFFLSTIGGYVCLCFAPLHRESVERYGDRWHEAGHIVTSGPFTVAEWEVEEKLVLVKDERWRGADEVSLDRIEVSFWRESEDGIQAVASGDLDVFWAPGVRSIQGRHGQTNPLLNSVYVGFNVARVPDPRQRRAMALAIDRTDLNERAYEGAGRPATSLTADGVPAFERIRSRFLDERAALAEAEELLGQVEQPVDEVTLWTNEERRSEASAVQEAWGRLGLRVTPRVLDFDQLFTALSRGRFEAYITGWVYDFPDAINFLQLWRCDDPDNYTRFCDRAYDRLLDRALVERDDAARVALYAAAERVLTGPEGAMPGAPLVWGSLPVAVGPEVEGFELNPMAQADLTAVRVARPG